MLFAKCISTSDRVRLNILANLYLIFDLYYHANIFSRAYISKHGCTSIGTDLCINALVLIRILVFIYTTL